MASLACGNGHIEQMLSRLMMSKANPEVDIEQVREAMGRLKGTTDYVTESSQRDLQVWQLRYTSSKVIQIFGEQQQQQQTI